MHYDLSFSLMYVQSNNGTKMHYLLSNAKNIEENIVCKEYMYMNFW